MQAGDEKSKVKLVINFESAVALMKEAISRYLSSHRPLTGKYGFWHGSTGERRAHKLLKYLNAIPVNPENQIALLSLFRAFFGEPTFFSQIGRSRQLAGMIAEKWIEVADTHFGLNIIDPPSNPTSKVFSGDILAEAIADRSNSSMVSIVPEVGAGAVIFDTVKAVRKLLKQFIDRLSSADQTRVKALSVRFEKVLDNRSEDIELRIIPEAKSVEDAYVEGALMGAFLEGTTKVSKSKPGTLKVTDLPPDAVAKIASYLTSFDASKSLRRVNKAANTIAKENKAAQIAKLKEKKSDPQPTTSSPSLSSSSSSIDASASAVPNLAGYFKPADNEPSSSFSISSLTAQETTTRQCLAQLTEYFSETQLLSHSQGVEGYRDALLVLRTLALDENAMGCHDLIMQHRDLVDDAFKRMKALGLLEFEEFPFPQSSSQSHVSSSSSSKKQ